MRELQDIAAATLGMQRGRSAEITRAKHKSHIEYKREMLENDLKAELARVKDLQEINKQLRSELQEAGATRKDYALLEQLNRELREEIKIKSLTVKDLQEIVADYKQNSILLTPTARTQSNEVDRSAEEVGERAKKRLKRIFEDSTTIREEGLIKKNYKLELAKQFTKKPNTEETSFFKQVSAVIGDLTQKIEEQSKQNAHLQQQNSFLLQTIRAKQQDKERTKTRTRSKQQDRTFY